MGQSQRMVYKKVPDYHGVTQETSYEGQKSVNFLKAVFFYTKLPDVIGVRRFSELLKIVVSTTVAII